MMPDPFYTNGLAFSCRQCSRCCRYEPGYVYLSHKDLTALCLYLNLNEERFISMFCRWVPYYNNTEALCLKEKPGYDCIFWDGYCSVYGARPVQCVTYPFWTYILKDAASWKEEGTSCPGIGSGHFYTKAEIEGQLALYSRNEPICRPY